MPLLEIFQARFYPRYGVTEYFLHNVSDALLVSISRSLCICSKGNIPCAPYRYCYGLQDWISCLETENWLWIVCHKIFVSYAKSLRVWEITFPQQPFTMPGLRYHIWKLFCLVNHFLGYCRISLRSKLATISALRHHLAEARNTRFIVSEVWVGWLRGPHGGCQTSVRLCVAAWTLIFVSHRLCTEDTVQHTEAINCCFWEKCSRLNWDVLRTRVFIMLASFIGQCAMGWVTRLHSFDSRALHIFCLLASVYRISPSFFCLDDDPLSICFGF